jgi:DNA replication protein DnaC
MFKPATKSNLKIRLALSGASGSGKTFSALAIASHIGKKIALIDTERGSASCNDLQY